MKTIYTPQHALHATEAITLDGQPFIIEELPARVELILAAIRAVELGPVLPPVDHGLEPVLAVHDAGLVSYLRSAYAENAAWLGYAEAVIPGTFAVGRRRDGPRPTGIAALRGYYAFGVGSPILPGTWDAAYWAAQCALTAADAVLAGERSAYALCRPPGHHAARDLYGGFCYLNHAAIAARTMAQTGARVAILDVDYHHGNGTQAIFYADSAVFYASLHADPHTDYPYYWGFAEERGTGAGLGTNFNLPLPRGTDDDVYLAALEEALAAIRAFAPHVLVLSLGLDIAAGDEVGGFDVTTPGFRAIGQRIAALGLPTVIIQEGGYRLDTLGENAVAVLRAF